MNESLDSAPRSVESVIDNVFRSRDERMASGKELRSKVSRESHAMLRLNRPVRDPVGILEESNQDRLATLIPVRYGRMLKSSFAFYRGSASLMAHDLAESPSTGTHVQACGDCHLLNFGLFATPERKLVFDINDFDETHPAPWEWDIKRLATSFVVAGRELSIPDVACAQAAEICVRAYRTKLREYSSRSPLDVWYEQLDEQALLALAPDEKTRKRRMQMMQLARERILEQLFPKIVNQVGGRFRFIDQPPILYHLTEPDTEERMLAGYRQYRQSLPDERKVLLDRYRLEDYAVKAVGVGSVGTRCLVLLLFSEENHPLVLQVKEATHSVLERYTSKCKYDNQGQRVVVGQRMIQSSSDIFLGWVRGALGYDFYVRQLRDMKFSVPVEEMTENTMCHYAELCGWCIAHAHAKSGDAAMISGYLGKSDVFDKAIASFALSYADRNEKDFRSLTKAYRDGRIQAISEDHL